MSHVRQQVRDKVISLLISGVPAVSGRVWASRIYALRDGKTPALTVYSISETVEHLSMGSSRLVRTLQLSVDIHADESVADYDDDVDDLAVAIEEAIHADERLSGLAKQIILSSTDIDFSGQGDTPTAVARLVFTVEYVTSMTDVENAL